MRSLKISAFADEYADSFEEQLTALNEFEIENIEIRFLNGKNISVLKRNEVTEAKKSLTLLVLMFRQSVRLLARYSWTEI